MNTNKKHGNEFEREFCQLLSQKGFWVLNIPQYSAGQPSDVIAVKDGAQKAWQDGITSTLS